ncbi:hypothetical protein H010_09681 [Hydrogenophaga taeniospiralis CCUG 15921]|uniref:SCP domain-containing protein n=1 Tax=Hydrogenophaga taeniospiralis CCUG 15921 TaxID=1281780 RepID=A0A9X4NPW5_9BURK|nr:CAP domain-containing protein [Hydrogenophaga taeniospiralis]MDG5975520.1 hypothetical protein [Hydrogenophaga taeniospiralis CCUG 15921]
MTSSLVFSVPTARRVPAWLGVGAVGVALLIACGGGGGSDAPGSDPSASGLLPLDASTSCDLPDFQAALLRQVNAARARARSCGSTALPAVPPLAWDARLFSAAARHSTDMAVHDYFSHTGRDGRTVDQRVLAEGYAWTSVGENIAAGPPSVPAVVAGWLDSPGHCSNLMRAGYVHVGVACVQRSGSTYGRYWTMVLARP